MPSVTMARSDCRKERINKVLLQRCPELRGRSLRPTGNDGRDESLLVYRREQILRGQLGGIKAHIEAIVFQIRRDRLDTRKP